MTRLARWTTLVLGSLLATGGARADRLQAPAPISVESVDAESCFDVATLEAEIRRRLPEAELGPGALARGGAQITVRRRGNALDIEVARRGNDGQPHEEHRAVPLGSDCRVLIDTTTSIVVRAVVPLGYRALAPPPLRRLPLVVVSVPAPHPAPVGLAQLQISLAIRLNLSTEGVSPGVGGLLEVAWRLQDFVIFVGGGAEESIPAQSASARSWLQRFPLVTGIGYEVPIPHGAVRLSAGLLVDLWTARFDDLLGPSRYVWVHPGLQASAAYHFRPTRLVDLYAGVDVEYAFGRDGYSSVDRSLEAITPVLWINPMLGAALNFF